MASVLDTRAEALIVCPETKKPLYRATLAEASRVGCRSEPLVPRASGALRPFGPTPTVLVRGDGECAYPLVDDAPVLLAPEMLTPASRPRDFDLTDPKHAEAYEEMPYYNRVATGWRRSLENGLLRYGDVNAHPGRASDDPVEEGLRLAALARRERRELSSCFPQPPDLWLHLRYESMALLDAYRHLAPLVGKRVLQIGGIGLDTVKFLLAGAGEAWIVSPMMGELDFALTLARACCVDGRLRRVLGTAEELPLGDATFDAVFAGGSVHHTLTDVALPECARVLKPGGEFASVEPWHGPGYVLGTRLLGKREPVACRPMNKARVKPLFRAFSRARVVHHGALTRYALIALWKLGIKLPMSTVRRVTIVDDALCSILPPLRRTGSCVALLASRAPAG